jgi:hypothetical protein
MCGSQKSIECVIPTFKVISFIDIKGSNMIKMVGSSFSAIPSYFVYHTLVDINIEYMIGG